MKFFEYETMYQSHARENNCYCGMENFSREAKNRNGTPLGRSYAFRLKTEKEWSDLRRPYFSIYPQIVPSLTSVRMDGVEIKQLRLRIRTILLRFPEQNGNLLTDKNGISVQSILVSNYDCECCPGIKIFANAELSNRKKYELNISSHLDRTIEDFITECSREGGGNTDLLGPIARVVCAIHLLSESADLIEPDVLTADQLAYDETGDQKYVERAIRKGKYGFKVGNRISEDVCPSIRRPHLGLRWTGKNGEIPKIVPIKGSIVRRRKLTEVPTGYLDDRDE